jgi:hypothetical protein
VTSKRFFFEKKNQKTFLSPGRGFSGARGRTDADQRFEAIMLYGSGSESTPVGWLERAIFA